MLQGNVVKTSVVSTHTKAAVLLLDKKDGSNVSGGGGSDEAALEHVCKLRLQLKLLSGGNGVDVAVGDVGVGLEGDVVVDGSEGRDAIRAGGYTTKDICKLKEEFGTVHDDGREGGCVRSGVEKRGCLNHDQERLLKVLVL